MPESTPHHYIAVADSTAPLFMAVRVRAEKRGRDFSNDLKFDLSLSGDADLPQKMLQTNHAPTLSAKFFGSRNEIQIDTISKGCLHAGQAFIASTITQIRELAPSAKTIYLANVMHLETTEIIRRALARNDGLALDCETSPGPLIRGILKSGGSHVFAVKEGNSGYIGLRASLLNTKGTA